MKEIITLDYTSILYNKKLNSELLEASHKIYLIKKKENRKKSIRKIFNI